MTGTYLVPEEKNLARIAQSIRDLYAGRNNCSGQFTLNVAPSTTTLVRAPNAGLEAYPFFTPLTANAATEFGGGAMYISSRIPGFFTVTHSSSANADRTFGFTCLG